MVVGAGTVTVSVEVELPQALSTPVLSSSARATQTMRMTCRESIRRITTSKATCMTLLMEGLVWFVASVDRIGVPR